MARSEGKENFLTTKTRKKLEAVQTKINNTKEAIKASEEQYDNKTFTEESTKFKLKKESSQALGKLVNEKVAAEYGLLSNQVEGEFLRSDDGKAIFDKTRYEVSKKKVKKDIDKAETKEEVDAIIAEDTTGTAEKSCKR